MKSFITYMNGLNKKQKIMIYLSVVFVGIMLLNQFLPAQLEQKEELQNNISTMRLEILKNATKKLKRELSQVKELKLEKEAKIDVIKERVNFLMSNLYKVKFAFFAQEELARSLDFILKESIKEKLELNFIKNTQENVPDQSELVVYKKSMLIDGVGEYKNILRFINFVENLDLLMSVQEIKLTEDSEKNGVHFSISLYLYGVGL